MGIRHLGVPGRGVDLAARIRDDLSIPEVIDQCLVVGVEQPCTAYCSERKHMHVVRLADALPANSCGMAIHRFVRYRAGASIPQGAPQPLNESPVPAQFLSQLSAHYQLSVRARQPIEESAAGRRAVASEYLVGHVGINDGAHLQSDRPSRFVHEELAVASRRIQQVALFIESQGMDMNVEIRSLEEQ